MRTVKVSFKNGNYFITRINGTESEIRHYYEIGSRFNIGSVEDDWQIVSAVEFLK